MKNVRPQIGSIVLVGFLTLLSLSIVGCIGNSGQVSINGLPLDAAAGANITLSATYSQAGPDDKGITWSLQCGSTAAGACGSLSRTTTPSCNAVPLICPTAETVYTAPLTPPPAAGGFFGSQVTIKAESISSPSRANTDVESVTINPNSGGPISVSLSATPSVLAAGASTPVTATVKNDRSGDGVSWEEACVEADCGSTKSFITDSGEATTYTAPSDVPTTITVTLTATSIADSSKFASAVITITASALTATTTTLTSSMNPSTFGQAVTFTATVSPSGPPTPTGSVTWSANTGCAASSLSSGSAVCTTTTLTVGTDTITADYGGDANYSGSNGTLTPPQVVSTGSTSEIITTIAGCCETTGGPGKMGYGGDGGPATSAELNAPYGVALDSAGNYYIADGANCLIRKVTVASGIISTVAGNVTGAPGANCAYSGDGGPATAAQLNGALGVVLDSSGNIYIADTGNSVIRVVNTQAGTITVAGVTIGVGDIQTVAGSASGSGFSGDGGPATSAQLFAPPGIALDSAGNIYIADEFNNVIRVVNTQASTITVAGVSIGSHDIQAVAGNGASGYSGDGGPATSAKLNQPVSLAVDSSGNLFVSDAGNNVIRRVSSTGTITTQVGNGFGAGTGSGGYSGDGGPATSAELAFPVGIALDSADNIFFSDAGNNVIRAVGAGTIFTVAGTGFGAGLGSGGYTGDGGPATSAELNGPEGLALDATGNFYFSDSVNNVIREVMVPTAHSGKERGASPRPEVELQPRREF